MERITVSWISGAGVDHEEVITGGRLVGACPAKTAVIRVYNADTLTAVHTFTGVDRMVWEPEGTS